jgi:type IV pilus assembly protein PilM
MFGIRTKWTSPIGLDIGHDSLKMLQLERQKGRLGIRGAAKLRFPEDIRGAQGGGYRRYHFVANSIQDILKNSSFKGRDVIISLPIQFYDYTYICLPEETLPPTDPLFISQAQEQLGLSEESSRIEPFPSGRVREGNALSQQYIVFGIDDDAWLEQRMMLDDIHFDPIEPDPIPCAFYRSLLLSQQNARQRNRTVLGVDIGGATSTVIILNDTSLSWVRQIDIGGQDLTNPIVKKLQLSPDEALQLRMRSIPASSDRIRSDETCPGRDSVDRVLEDIIRSKVDDLAGEIKLGLDYYGQRYQAQHPQEIQVFGGEAACPLVLRLLEKTLKMTVRIGRCFDGISMESGGMERWSVSPYSEWSTAIGLCLKPTAAKKLSIPA